MRIRAPLRRAWRGEGRKAGAREGMGRHPVGRAVGRFGAVCPPSARRRRSTQKHHAYIFCTARRHTLATLLDPWPHFGHTLATLWPHLFAPGCNKMLRIITESPSDQAVKQPLEYFLDLARALLWA